MKNCVKCGKSLPDTAMHCVFCGSKQDAAPAMGQPHQPSGPQAKTIMGYAAADMVKQLQQQQQQQGQENPAIAPTMALQRNPQGPAPGGFAGEAVATHKVPSHQARTIAASSNLPAFSGPPPAGAVPRAAPSAPSRPHGGHPGPPRGPQPGAPMPGRGPGITRTGGPPGAPKRFNPPAGPGVPRPAGPPGGPIPAPLPAHAPSGPVPGRPSAGPMPGQRPGGPPPGMPPGMHRPPGAHGLPRPGPGPGSGPTPAPIPTTPSGPYANQPQLRGEPPTSQVQPLQPPYRASDAKARMERPQEPWIATLKTVMLIFGIALVVCFAAPWTLSPTSFSWDVIKAQSSIGKLLPLLVGGTGLLAVVLSLLPLTVSARGVAAAFLGIVPIGLQVFLLAENLQWQSALVFVGTLTLIPGLLLRSEYHGAVAARIMVTIGVVCIIAPQLLPSGGQVPLIGTFKAIGAAAGKGKLFPIVEIAWITLVLLSLLVWLPAPSATWAKILSWAFIAQPVVLGMTALLLTPNFGDIGSTIKTGMFTVVLSPIASMSWNALTGYGVASVAGKSLEYSEG